MSTRTIPQLDPVPTLSTSALIEISQGALSYKATIQEALDLTSLANVGGGAEVFKGRNGSIIEFKTLVEGTNITFVEGTDTITINAATASGITSINSDTTAAQNIVGTTDRITVSDATNTHTINIASGYVGQASITTLGTISTGVWNATNIAYAKLTLTDSIVNADINSAAAIVTSKLADSANFVLKNQTNTFGDFNQIFKDDKLVIENPAGTFYYNIMASNITTSVGVILPVLSSSDTFAMVSLAQTLANKTLTTPTIASFANATHNHADAAGGGQLTATTALNATGTPSGTTFLRGDNVWATPAGSSGDVVGPASATDNAVARFDTTTGKLIQNSGVIIDDTNNITGLGTLNTHTIPAGTSTFAILSNKLSVFAATTSAELAGVISDETGSGVLVFADTPTLVTPILGTPTSGTLTNCTGLPVSGLVALTADRALITNGTGVIAVATTTATEIGYVSGVTSAIQTQLNARVSLTGAETVDGKTFTGVVRIQNALGSALATTGTVDIDFSTNEVVTMAAMTGNVTFTGSNYAAGRSKTIRIIGGASAFTFAFPSGWKFMGSAAPASLAIGKYAILTLFSVSTTEAEVIAAYAAQP